MNPHLKLQGLAFIAIILMSCNTENQMTEPAGNDADGYARAASPANPVITEVLPATTGEIGDLITIKGNNFGPKKSSSSFVSFCGKQATVYSLWTKTQIQVLIPSGASTSSGSVVVTVGSKTSNPVNFTILPSSPVTIGTQVWMGANLDVATYRNGDPIPQVTDPTEWDNLTTGAWCYYNNDPVLGAIYGKLYNWYAVNDPRGLAPDGWHVATDDEFKALSIHLGMSPAEADQYGYAYFGTDEGGKMKEAGTSLWAYPNLGATNSSGFTALPGSMRSGLTTADFVNLNIGATFWCATEYDNAKAWCRALDRNSPKTYRNILIKQHGFSVRCVEDNN